MLVDQSWLKSCRRLACSLFKNNLTAFRCENTILNQYKTLVKITWRSRSITNSTENLCYQGQFLTPELPQTNIIKACPVVTKLDSQLWFKRNKLENSILSKLPAAVTVAVGSISKVPPWLNSSVSRAKRLLNNCSMTLRSVLTNTSPWVSAKKES